VLGAAALLWPDPVRGPFDGVPLDLVAEAVLVGFIFPALWWFHPRFLATLRARVCIVALVLWKICSVALFVPEGWCLRFEPARPFAKDAGRAPHAWDLRADWRAHDPACSAVMSRSYRISEDMPVWFFNLPPDNDSWPQPEDRPPKAIVTMRVHGYLSALNPGLLQFDTRPDLAATISIDGQAMHGASRIDAGTHFVAIDAVLTGDRWALVPQWNGTELWEQVTATQRRPASLDLVVRPWIRWVPTLATLALLSLWIASALQRVGDGPVLAWAAAMSVLIGWLVHANSLALTGWAIAAFGAAVFVRVPTRLRNLRGAFVLIGIPWLTFVLVGGIPAIGRVIRLYSAGNDEWMYQRFAYRIVLQGYWLEGGSPTFYFQPFYRWIVGLLHAIFGDSSVGERFWDGACLLAGAMLSFRITRAFAGFRWGLVAAATTLGVFALGTARYLIGFGLSEISSAGLVSTAALCAIGSRRRRTSLAIAAGLLATFAFYTRLNNLIMALGVSVFALPLRLRLREIIHPAGWWQRVSWRTVFAVAGAVSFGLLFFAWRTWHYTGVFSIFHGTTRYVVAVWQPGMPLRAGLARLAHSVMMVLTVNDPPRFDVYALPVLGGALVAVLSIAGVPRLRELPAAAVLFFFSAIAGAFIAFGWEYAGRFSIHVLPITCALATCGVAALVGRGRVISPQWRGRGLKRQPATSTAAPQPSAAATRTTAAGLPPGASPQGRTSRAT
jgi:hypothetical protein